MHCLRVITLILLLTLWLAAPVQAAHVESFSPQGEQLDARQAQARFSAPMTALGRSDAAAPFNVECSVSGNGYWADERTWVYDLTQIPAPGAPCRFISKPGLTTLSGEKVAAADYAFAVAGPRLLASLPSQGTTVDEDQVFVLLLNGPAQAESMDAHARCEAEGIHEQLRVQRLQGAERSRILRQLKDQLYDLGENWEGRDASQDKRLEVLRCQRTLPANTKVSLVWGAGIATGSGQTNPSEQRFSYTVRDHFVARMRCQRENAKAGCLPLTPIRLDFTAPVARELLDRVKLKDALGKLYPRKRADQEQAMDDGIEFSGPFPANARLSLSLPGKFVDDKGRGLVNAARFPMQFQLADLPPLIKFSGDFGIIERVGGSLLPITLRNLEGDPNGTTAKIRWVRLSEDKGILDWQKALHRFDNPPYVPNVEKQPDPRRARLLTPQITQVVERTLPKPNGAQAFEVVGLPLERPGFYILEAESQRLGKSLLGENQPMYVRSSALVTNMAVHFKWGPASSLVWVTRLDLGTPVAAARIAVRDCRGRLLAEASTDQTGMALLPKNLPDPNASEYECPLFVSARKDDDLSFARSDWNEGIESWRFGLPGDWGSHDRVARSLLDRTLFRPGETVHMQHILREKRDTGIGHTQTLPPTLLIEHGASQQKWFLPLSWRNGAASTEWKVPQGAKRGDYSLRLLNKEIRPEAASEQLEYLEGLDSGTFSVGDFRVPLMRAEIDPVGNPVGRALVAAKQADFDLSVRYLNGGGGKHLPVKLRAQLEPRFSITFDQYKDVSFAMRKEDDNRQQESEPVMLPNSSLKLDANGVGRGRIEAMPALTMPHSLRVEMEYADPNGEIQTVSRSTPWWPAQVVLGLKNGRWLRAGQSHTLHFQAVDLTGKPAAEVPVEAKLTLRQTFSHRVRLTGGFYAYQSETRETALAAQCQGKTDAKGQFSCQAQTDIGGEVEVSARAIDQDGRAASTYHSFWVAGRDDWVFEQANHDRIDLLPEKKRYEPGETARFQVRMPYRNATALVTVEREGVLDARVVTLSGKAPVIEIPVRAGWAPNVFVSALVVRGRNDEIKPGALIDLGRPAFKLGIAGIEVGQRAHRLEVEVKTDRASYQVREKARARIKVRTPEGGLPPAGTEVTLAAVDEGLLELAPNDSWNLLSAMMAERGYAMQTFTGQLQVTGKRHFGKKAVPAGGGGGKLPTRELFDTLLFWQARVGLDAQGEVQVEIPLNDSLTAFRIVAIAASESRFGSGHTSISSSQDLQLISGLSPVVREGDRLQAYFTVRNGSQRSMKIEVRAAAQGLPELPPRMLTLAAGDAEEIVWPLQVPDQQPQDGVLAWTLNARELNGKARDALSVKQAVHAAIPLRVQASSLYRLEQPLDLPVGLPQGSLPGGELRATLSASLVDGQTGLRDYMRRYPYSCLEQQVSKAVAMQNRTALDEIADKLPTYLAESGLANFFPGDGRGSVALTAYVLAIADQAGWRLPADALNRMQNGLIAYVSGQNALQRQAWENPVVLRLAALEALARAGKATPELIATIKPEPNLWLGSALLDWIGVLQKTPQLAGRDRLLRDALAALEGRFTYTGKRLNFSRDSSSDDIWWMLSSADTSALRAVLTLMPEAAWRERLPKLVSGALARQQDGRWNTTTANAWGVLALQRYQQMFEAVKPAGKSYAVLGKDGRVVDWKAYPKGATAFLPLTSETASLKLRHEGEGQPYVSVTTLAAVPITAPVQRGYSVKREIVPIDQKTPGKWRRGDVLRIRLDIDARDDMGWVVVEDPIPAGATILASGKQRGSALLTQDENQRGDAWPAWQERLFDTYRAYYEYVPRGRFKLEYTIRLNSDGQFQMPPTRVEAMYAPEMFGEAPNALFKVVP